MAPRETQLLEMRSDAHPFCVHPFLVSFLATRLGLVTTKKEQRAHFGSPGRRQPHGPL